MTTTITIYDRSNDGLATAVLNVEGRESAIMFRASSITQIRNNMGAYKRKNHLLRTPTETKLNVSYEDEHGSSLTTIETSEVPQTENHGMQVIETPTPANVQNLSKFSVDERFEMMEDCVRMVLGGFQSSLLITGTGGVGKTYTILDVLHKEGYVKVSMQDGDDEDLEDDINQPAPEKVYRQLKGGCSPTELFKILHDYNDEILVFDDFDSALSKDPNVMNMLKAALDTEGGGGREISWFSPYIKKAGYPNQFVFTGKIIFISNFTMSKIPQPLLSRSFIIALDFTKDEIVDRMKSIAPIMLQDLNADQIDEVIEWIEEKKDILKDLSLRTLFKVSRFVAAGLKNWKSLAEFSS